MANAFDEVVMSVKTPVQSVQQKKHQSHWFWVAEGGARTVTNSNTCF